MKLLLVPTDFSPTADNAMKYAMDMALAMGAKIMLVNTYEIPISFSEVPLVTVSVEQLHKMSQEKLSELKHNIDTITGGKLHVYTESRLGSVSEEVKKFCDTLDPYAVVMGTRGISGAGQFFLGSNSMSVIEKIDTPVFIIPPGVRFKPFRKVGLATDMENVSESIPVSPIRELVNFFNSDLHVLNVDYHEKHVTSYTPEESLRLDTMLSDMHPVYDMVQNKDVEEGLNDFTEKNNIDLLITVPKKRHFLEKILEPSTTRKLIYHTMVPLMCIKMKKEEKVAKTQHS